MSLKCMYAECMLHSKYNGAKSTSLFWRAFNPYDLKNGGIFPEVKKVQQAPKIQGQNCSVLKTISHVFIKAKHV